MTTHDQRMMLLDIDGILTHHHATPIDVLTAAQALAVSAIGDLTNKAAPAIPHPSTGRGAEGGAGYSPPLGEAGRGSLHRFADLAADQIRAALHARIDLGHRPDW